MQKTRIRAIILDAMGVIYEDGDDVAELLIPFARRNGCWLPDEDICDLYHDASLGLCSSGEFWAEMGLVATGLDEEYVTGHALMPGLPEFLGSMREKGISVGCISNDVAEWSLKLRRLHRLEEHISTWVISGDLGVRKPDRRIFRCFLQASGHRPADCLFLDDNPRNVHAARRLGFRALLFASDAYPVPRRERRVVRSFDDVMHWLEENR